MPEPAPIEAPTELIQSTVATPHAAAVIANFAATAGTVHDARRVRV